MVLNSDAHTLIGASLPQFDYYVSKSVACVPLTDVAVNYCVNIVWNRNAVSNSEERKSGFALLCALSRAA